MKITWLGHSCFKLESNGKSVVLDPYADGSVPGLSNIREVAGAVFCSHGHADHNGASCVTVSQNETGLIVSTIDTFHDEVNGAKRGPNKITIISDGEIKVAHMGDLGCDLTAKQKEALKDTDVMLIPVGGFFTIDAAKAMDIVHESKPKHVIPMHYRDDKLGTAFEVISTVVPFAELAESLTVFNRSVYDTEELVKAQVIILQPQNIE